MGMPYYHFREIWTPLIIFGVRFYKDNDDQMWYKIGKRHKKKFR